MNSRNPRKVALLVETDSSYGRGLIRGIAEYARLHASWAFHVRDGRLPADLDGVLALIRSRREASRLGALNVPVVDLDYALPELKRTWGVCHDESAVGELAARHLLDCGLRRFAYVGWDRDGGPSTFWETERRESFRRRLRREGFEAACFRRPSGGSEAEGLTRWLKRLPRPCGLFAANDQRGVQVLAAARRSGLRVPQDLAVLGVDDDPVLCELASPPLSSIVLDTRRVGFEGAALLDRLMRGRRPPRTLRLIGPLGVTARRSSDLFALEDETVSRALRLIRDDIHRPLSVRDLAHRLGVARRSLEFRFRKSLSRSPYQEILRARAAKVADLLCSTDWPLKRIAQAAGYAYTEQMHASFRRVYGVTPSRYRLGDR